MERGRIAPSVECNKFLKATIVARDVHCDGKGRANLRMPIRIVRSKFQSTGLVESRTFKPRRYLARGSGTAGLV